MLTCMACSSCQTSRGHPSGHSPISMRTSMLCRPLLRIISAVEAFFMSSL